VYHCTFNAISFIVGYYQKPVKTLLKHKLNLYKTVGTVLALHIGRPEIESKRTKRYTVPKGTQGQKQDLEQFRSIST
jgi:hypothetical protein